MQTAMKLLGSVVAPAIGAAAGIAAMRLAEWTDWRICALMMGLFVAPLWLLVLLPLYLLLPRTSCLWRPAIFTGLGCVAGAILVTIYFAVSPDAPFEIVALFLPFAVIVGGVTCFVGATTALLFHGTRTA
jgi:hypothetical protein